MKRPPAILVFILIFFGISITCNAGTTGVSGTPDIYRSVYVGGLSPDQFLSVNMPKDKCAPWVMWETGDPDIPKVTIIHIAEHLRRPRLHVISQVNNKEAFKKILERIRKFWNGSGISPIEKTIEGDLIAIITFPGQTIDMAGNSTMYIPNTILINTTEHAVFLGQIDKFARDKKLYKNSTIDLWCNDIPAEIVNNFPYPKHIAAR